MTRLLILADMLDVHHLMVKVGRARQDLELMRKVGSQQELMEWMRRLESSLTELRQEAGGQHPAKPEDMEAPSADTF